MPPQKSPSALTNSVSIKLPAAKQETLDLSADASHSGTLQKKGRHPMAKGYKPRSVAIYKDEDAEGKYHGTWRVKYSDSKTGA